MYFGGQFLSKCELALWWRVEGGMAQDVLREV